MSAVPTPYDRTANFVTLSQGTSATVGTIATAIDREFDLVDLAMDETQSRLAELQRDDGALAHGIVSIYSLGADTVALIASSKGSSFKGAWVTATAYVVGDSVAQSGVLYFCLQDHTSGTFATDLAASRWVVASVGDGSVTTTKLADNSVSTAKVINAAVTTAKIADGAVTAAKIASNSITTEKITDGSITTSKLDANLKIGGATGSGADRVFFENDQTVTSNYTITTGKNAMSAGPITLANGVTITVPSGSTYTVV